MKPPSQGWRREHDSLLGVWMKASCWQQARIPPCSWLAAITAMSSYYNPIWISSISALKSRLKNKADGLEKKKKSIFCIWICLGACFSITVWIMTITKLFLSNKNLEMIILVHLYLVIIKQWCLLLQYSNSSSNSKILQTIFGWHILFQNTVYSFHYHQMYEYMPFKLPTAVVFCSGGTSHRNIMTAVWGQIKNLYNPISFPKLLLNLSHNFCFTASLQWKVTQFGHELWKRNSFEVLNLFPAI